MGEARNDQDLIEALRRSTAVIVWAVIAAALAVIVTLFYLRSQEPYWKCRSLSRGGVMDGEIDIWEDLNCDDPSLLPPDEE